jgi:hypothetical protein
MLSPHTQPPDMSEPTVSSDLLQSLEIISQLRVNAVGKDLRVFAVDDIFLSVEEPGGNFVVGWVLDDGHDALEFVRVEVSGTWKASF